MHPEIARAQSVLLIRRVCNVLSALAIALVTLVYLVAAAALASGLMAIVLALHLRRLTLERGTTLA